MLLWLIYIPLISACTGWLFNRILISMLFYPRRPVRMMGFTMLGQLPKYHQQVAENLGTWITSYLPIHDIKEKLSSKDNLQKIMPRVEEHIDHFLKVKLPLAMPVIGMFVGDKTISQLKAVFMSELADLFPLIMQEYMDQLEPELDFNKLVSRKLTTLAGKETESAIKKLLSRQFLFIQIAGALFGCITGVLQVLVILIFQD